MSALVNSSRPKAATMAGPVSSYYIPGTNLKTFTVFAKCAPEIQDIIWSFACVADPSVIGVRIDDDSCQYVDDIPAIPAILHTTSGSRGVALKHFQVVDNGVFDREVPRPIGGNQVVGLGGGAGAGVAGMGPQQINQLLQQMTAALPPQFHMATTPTQVAAPFNHHSNAVVPFPGFGNAPVNAMFAGPPQLHNAPAAAIQNLAHTMLGPLNQQNTFGTFPPLGSNFINAGTQPQLGVHGPHMGVANSNNAGGPIQIAHNGLNLNAAATLFTNSQNVATLPALPASLPINQAQALVNHAQGAVNQIHGVATNALAVANQAFGAANFAFTVAHHSQGLVNQGQRAINQTRRRNAARRTLGPSLPRVQKFYINPDCDVFMLQVGPDNSAVLYQYPEVRVSNDSYSLRPKRVIAEVQKLSTMITLNNRWPTVEPKTFPAMGKLPTAFTGLQHIAFTLVLPPCSDAPMSNAFRTWIRIKVNAYLEKHVRSTLAHTPDVQICSFLVSGGCKNQNGDAMMLKNLRDAPVMESNGLTFGAAELSEIYLHLQMWFLGKHCDDGFKEGSQPIEPRIVGWVPEKNKRMMYR